MLSNSTNKPNNNNKNMAKSKFNKRSSNKKKQSNAMIHPHIELIQSEIDTLVQEIENIDKLQQERDLTTVEQNQKDVAKACLEKYQATLAKLNDTTMVSKLRSYMDINVSRKNEAQTLFLLQFFYIVRLGQLGLFDLIEMESPKAMVNAITDVCDQLIGASVYHATETSPQKQSQRRKQVFDILKKLETSSEEVILDNISFKDIKALIQHIWDNTQNEKQILENAVIADSAAKKWAVLPFENMVQNENGSQSNQDKEDASVQEQPLAATQEQSNGSPDQEPQVEPAASNSDNDNEIPAVNEVNNEPTHVDELEGSNDTEPPPAGTETINTDKEAPDASTVEEKEDTNVPAVSEWDKKDVNETPAVNEWDKKDDMEAPASNALGNKDTNGAPAIDEWDKKDNVQTPTVVDWQKTQVAEPDTTNDWKNVPSTNKRAPRNNTKSNWKSNNRSYNEHETKEKWVPEENRGWKNVENSVKVDSWDNAASDGNDDDTNKNWNSSPSLQEPKQSDSKPSSPQPAETSNTTTQQVNTPPASPKPDDSVQQESSKPAYTSESNDNWRRRGIDDINNSRGRGSPYRGNYRGGRGGGKFRDGESPRGRGHSNGGRSNPRGRGRSRGRGGDLDDKQHSNSSQ